MRSLREELPTLALLILCYLGFAAVSIGSNTVGPIATALILSVLVALHASLQHEILHGHPFKNQFWNDVLVFPAIGVFVPYQRFRDTHLDHHKDPNLTDPYDDPESNFLDPQNWDRLPGVAKRLYDFNNTLAGRMTVGPALGLWQFYVQDIRAILGGQARVLAAYVLHAGGLVLVGMWWAIWASAPFWTLLAAAYGGMSILKIRTFLEHRAHERSAARTVVIEDRGLLALLFLNNNFHSVHHAHPKIAWHKLPAVFHSRREEFMRRNDAYYYRSYAEIFRLYFLRVKDPVAHPLMRAGRGNPGDIILPIPAVETMDIVEKDHVDVRQLADVRPTRVDPGALCLLGADPDQSGKEGH